MPSRRTGTRTLGIRRLSVFLPVLILYGLPAAAGAVSMHWKATPADASWSNGSNWDEGHPPNPGDDLTFPATSTILATNNDLAAGLNVSSIAFNGAGYTLAGNGIVSGEILCTTGVTGTNALSLPVTVNTTIVVGTHAGCTIDLESNIDGPGGIFASGDGSVVLGGTDSYAGVTKATRILTINGTLTGTSGVIVNETSGNPILRGTGSFSAPLTIDNAFPTDTAIVAPRRSRSL